MGDNPKELYVQTGMEIIDGTATQYVFGDSLSADPSRCFGPKYIRADLAAEEVRELVKAAYREGYEDGAYVRGGIDNCWDRSNAQRALAKARGEV